MIYSKNTLKLLAVGLISISSLSHARDNNPSSFKQSSKPIESMPGNPLERRIYEILEEAVCFKKGDCSNLTSQEALDDLEEIRERSSQRIKESNKESNNDSEEINIFYSLLLALVGNAPQELSVQGEKEVVWNEFSSCVRNRSSLRAQDFGVSRSAADIIGREIQEELECFRDDNRGKGRYWGRYTSFIGKGLRKRVEDKIGSNNLNPAPEGHSYQPGAQYPQPSAPSSFYDR